MAAGWDSWKIPARFRQTTCGPVQRELGWSPWGRQCASKGCLGGVGHQGSWPLPCSEHRRGGLQGCPSSLWKRLRKESGQNKSMNCCFSPDEGTREVIAEARSTQGTSALETFAGKGTALTCARLLKSRLSYLLDMYLSSWHFDF